MNQGLITFSIIVPTYNSAKTLEACIQSIIYQTYDKYEVWFIDGLSNDKTLDIIRKYQSEIPQFHLVTEKDKGIYDAMNKGIDLARGRWIYFLGSDDTFYDPGVLSKIKGLADETTAGVIYGNVLMRGQNQWNLDNVVFDGEYNLEKFLDRNICHQAIFSHHTVFKKNGNFDLKYITSADFDFNLRCYANTAFQYIDIIIANFFVGGHSTNVPDIAFYSDRGALLMKYFKRKIFNRSFINSRLYLQQAALSSASPLNFIERLYCLLACIWQKLVSIFL